MGRLFDQINKDGSGYIGLSELSESIKRYGTSRTLLFFIIGRHKITPPANRLLPDITKLQLKNLIKAADKDNSGSLDKTEFVAFISGAPEKRTVTKVFVASTDPTHQFGAHLDRHECQDTMDLMTEVYKYSGHHEHIKKLPREGKAKFILGEMKTEPAGRAVIHTV